MKILKKLIIPFILLVIIIGSIIIISTVDFGALVIDIIERTSRIEVSYTAMEGSILRGYRIEQYCVRLSDTDSICGPRAEIKYRFIPSLLRLPNLFEITLLEPSVYIKQKARDKEKEGSGFAVPRLSLGIRFNVKNGTVNYMNDRLYTFENISGLVFVDLIGSVIYLNTMNLSLRSTTLPVNITSANLDMRISDQAIEIKSLRVKGKGFTVKGAGLYAFVENSVELTVNKAHVELAQFNLHKGSIDFSGEVLYRNHMIQPYIKGVAQGIEPVDQCNFETNVFGDTIFVNLFDGQLFDGTIFAQLKLINNTLYEVDANFKDIDISHFLSLDQRLVVQGYMAYRDKSLQGFITSPAHEGFGIDSLYLYGDLRGDSVYIDSLFVQEQGRVMQAMGRAMPACSMDIELRDFSVDRFVKFTLFPDTAFTGILTGSCHLDCSSKYVDSMLVSGSISGRDFRIGDVRIQEFLVTSDEFRISDQSNTIHCNLFKPAFKTIAVDSIALSIDDHAYFLVAKKADDYIKAQGNLTTSFTGTIATLSVLYHGIETHNNTPIEFDIPNRIINDFDLSFARGTLRGSLEPLTLDLSGADLTEISALLGLPDPIEGVADCRIRRNRIYCTAHHVTFIGLHDGTVQIKGEIDDGTIMVEELTINDSTQSLSAHAIISKEQSDIRTSFSNVGVWVLPFLEDFMLEPKGLLTGELGLSGTVEDFAFDGTVKLEQGSFGIEPIAAHFDSVQGEVRFEGKKIIFKTGHGVVNRMGRYTSSGTKQSIIYTGGLVTLGPRFRLLSFHYDFSFKDAPLQFMPFAYGIGSGNVSIGMRDDTTYYKGAITIEQAIVPLEFGQELEEDTSDVKDNWTMNIKIKGERNIWLRNRDADIEMGGELFIIKERGPLYLTGVLNTRRGNYYWLNHTLSITEGRLTFLLQEVVDAELDIWAAMDTRDRDPTTGTPITIKLHMFGTISEPIFEFFSDPPYYTEQDIVMYLNLNITWSELESMKRGDFVQTVLPHSLVSWLESDVSRRIRQYTGLDYFRIETPFFEEESRTRLTVGKYISRKLFITYTYDITSFENEFNVEYFIDDKNEILIRRDEEGEYSVQYQHRIRF